MPRKVNSSTTATLIPVKTRRKPKSEQYAVLPTRNALYFRKTEKQHITLTGRTTAAPATANQAEKRRYRNPQKKALRHNRTISSESKEKKRHRRFREKETLPAAKPVQKSVLSILLSNWTPTIAGNTPSAANAVFTLTFNIELPRILCMPPEVIRETCGLKRL
ncbi:MAG: hypothetical protein ACLU99_06075 [Alphaproteobacteria bacterium]